MTNKKPTPLKDEKPDPIEELQELVAELIVTVNSLAEKDTNTAERQPDERLQNTISTAVVKAVQTCWRHGKGSSRKPIRAK